MQDDWKSVAELHLSCPVMVRILTFPGLCGKMPIVLSSLLRQFIPKV